MDDSAAAAGAVTGLGRFLPARWAVARESPGFIGYAFLVEATVLMVATITVFAVPPRPRDVLLLAVLVAMGVVQAEIGHGVERLRRRVDNTPHINLTSVWTFAGVMLLPPALIAVLVAVLYTHLALRSWHRLRNTPPFRSMFNAALAVLSSYASYRVLTWSGVDWMGGALEQGWASLGGIAAAIATYFVVAAIIVLPGLKPANRTFQELFGGWVDNGLEAATLLGGALAALALETLPFLIAALMALLFFVHRGVLVKQLEVLASTDEKTGLFNARGWHRLASETLSRAEREQGTGAVLMVDVDHFKKVNDTYGHLAGDDVLGAIAGVLTKNVRDYDAVGRFGGEEFVILLPDIATDDALRVAERIREAIGWLRVPTTTLGGRTEVIRGLSVSIGVAPYPDVGLGIEELLGAADTALDFAKHYGRNQIRMASIG
jgi:diguanylate cyclase (GGDEF)-like protein